MRKNFLSRFAVIVFCMFALLGVALFLQPSNANATQPNIILISTDDMGWGDLCKNNPSSAACQQYTCDTSIFNAKCAKDSDCTGTLKPLGCKQSNTPRLDSLSSAGVTLTNFYTPTPICSPSRAALMTGQDPRRPQIYSALLGVASEKFLDKNFTTIAKVLGASYNTAIIGKWHLGWDQPTPLKEKNCPNNDCNSWDHGFQYNYVLPLGIGQAHNGFCLVEKFPNIDSQQWYYIDNILPIYNTVTYGDEQYLSVGGDAGSCKIENTNKNRMTFSAFSAGQSLTQKLTEKAIDYINSVKAAALATTDQKPFFLYLAYPAPHQPLYIHLKQDIATSYSGWNGVAYTYLKPWEVRDACYQYKGSDGYGGCYNNPLPLTCMQKCESSRIYHDVIKEVDVNIGSLLKEICGDADNDGNCDSPLFYNTVVIFTSDNGPYMGDAAEYVDRGSTGGLRGAKRFTYEGGVRVPFIARWPGGKWLGGVKREQPADMMDILPTLVRAVLCPIKGDCAAVTADLATDTTVIKTSGYEIHVDGKDISTVLRGGLASQKKDIQISWFGNYSICVSWNTTTGTCSKTEDSYPFAIRSIDTANTSLNNYKLHIASNPPAPTTVLSETEKIYNPPDSRKISKPIELYNLYPTSNPGEGENGNLCISTSLIDPATNKPVNCCQSEKCKTYSNCKCGSDTDSTSDAQWDIIYGPIVQELWRKTYEYDKQVRSWVPQ